MTWLKYGWKEEVLQWLKQRSLSQDIGLFGEQPLITAASQREEEAFSHFQARVQRRLRKALRQGNYSMLLGFSA